MFYTIYVIFPEQFYVSEVLVNSIGRISILKTRDPRLDSQSANWWRPSERHLIHFLIAYSQMSWLLQIRMGDVGPVSLVGRALDLES